MKTQQIELELHKVFKELIEVWAIQDVDENSIEKYSIKDNEKLKPSLNLSYFYQTHLLPQPWWGNIVDPNIIVLALNPSYDPINDEEDEKVIRESLIKNLKGHTFLNWFDYTSEKGKTDSSGFKFWKKSLGSLLEEGKNEEYILKNMGFFNFCGYHSNPFKSIPEKCFVEDYKLLATQSKLVEYLNLLIEHENPYVIVLWGYDYWKKAGLEVKQSKLVIVNKYKGRNHNITNIYTHKESLRNIVDDCINNNNNNSDVSLRYQELYKSLKGIIQD